MCGEWFLTGSHYYCCLKNTLPSMSLFLVCQHLYTCVSVYVSLSESEGVCVCVCVHMPVYIYWIAMSMHMRLCVWMKQGK